MTRFKSIDGGEPIPLTPEEEASADAAYLAWFSDTFPARVQSYRESKEKTVVEEGALSSYCDNQSVNGLMECINHLTDDLSLEEISWHGPNGAALGDIEGLTNLRYKVVSTRQKSRLAEQIILENHAQTPYTDDSWVADFDEEMG